MSDSDPAMMTKLPRLRRKTKVAIRRGKDWALDRVAHTAFHWLPNDVCKPKWGWRERAHVWGVERCASRHFYTCWEPVEDE